jgi:hypothetical protein
LDRLGLSSPGACGIPEEQHMTVQVDAPEPGEAPASGYFDLLVGAKWNRASCRMLERDRGPAATWSGDVCRRLNR